jgi:subtilisin family serine protease
VLVAALTVAAVLPPTSANAEPAPVSVGAPDSVTLITGDRVELSPTGSPMIVPAAGRETMQYRVTTEDGNVRVIPLDAVPLLADGVLDPRLFDVTALRDAGYADAANPDLGLIVRQDPAARSAAPALRAARDLPAADAASVRVAKVDTPALWESLADRKSGLTKVWLNGRRELSLAHSVPQIGAPAAWQAGYTGGGTTVAVLDSGIDATHPDLAGRVAEVANFTTEPDGDQYGHGTHVASIVTGVAPGTRLLDAKVCERWGCPEDAILAGMAWAAARAPVVNMSLGGPDTEGVDPLEAAVNELSATHGTLFVISAGNGGELAIGSPGTADAALSVAAVDRNDAVPDFSSRGPRREDRAIKPELAAPGVEIVAAQAAGTAMGTPTGDGHTAASGTSMAAPHVAGAAALLAQRHPDWTGGLLKAALMGTAKPVGGVFETGAGRLDAARAVTQDVTASLGSVSFGLAMWPHGDDPVLSQQVTYRNDGPADVVLDIVAPAPFTATPATVTVPAGGTEDVTVSVDTKSSSVAIGMHTGQVVASGGGVSVTTPVAVEKEDERYSVTLTHIGRDGNTPREHVTSYDLVGDCPDRLCGWWASGTGPTTTLRLSPGEYVFGDVTTVNGFDQDAAFLLHPKLVVSGDVAATLDARAAKPIEVTAPRGEVQNVRLTIGFDLRSSVIGTYVLNTGPGSPLYVGQAPGSPAGSVHSLVNATFAEPGPAGDFTDSPYVYNLASTQAGMLDGVRLTAAQRDFARVEASYATVSAAPRIAQIHHAGNPLTGPEWFADPPTLYVPLTVSHLPIRVTEFYLADGFSWASGMFHATDTGMPMDINDGQARHVYQKGRTYRVDWNKGVLGPAFDSVYGAKREGDRFTAEIKAASDATHLGSAAHPGSARLLRDGEVIVDWPVVKRIDVALPPEEATYQLERTASTGADISTEISSRWTFRSGHTSAKTSLPLLAVRFTPVLDDHNRAAPGRFTVPVAVQRQPGAAPSPVDTLTVDVSYDDGATWQPTRVSGGKAHVDNPAGGAVSLRATATDRAGNRVEQTIKRAYLVKPAG